jgi:hypothetical protein
MFGASHAYAILAAPKSNSTHLGITIGVTTNACAGTGAGAGNGIVIDIGIGIRSAESQSPRKGQSVSPHFAYGNRDSMYDDRGEDDKVHDGSDDFPEVRGGRIVGKDM